MHFDYPSDSSVFALVALDYCPSFGLAANQLADQEERKEKISYGVLILRTQGRYAITWNLSQYRGENIYEYTMNTSPPTFPEVGKCERKNTLSLSSVIKTRTLENAIDKYESKKSSFFFFSFFFLFTSRKTPKKNLRCG